MIVHDHFDGSAHCVECKGSCQLSGDALNVTRLVRSTIEREALDGYCWPFIVETIDALIGKQRASYLRQRAVATTEPIKRTRR